MMGNANTVKEGTKPLILAAQSDWTARIFLLSNLSTTHWNS
jgi:hypothetical protein